LLPENFKTQMNINSILEEAIIASLKSLFQIEIEVSAILLQPTRKEFDGSHTFVVFPYTKFSKVSPEETGKMIGEQLLISVPQLDSYNTVKGFLNLVIKDSFWIEKLYEVSLSNNWGNQNPNGKKVMVEYSSPNTNKPLHLGHLRNNFLGFSVANILKANGYEVIKANLVNDRGIHICKSMLAYQKFGNGETPSSSGLKGDHLAGKYYVEFDKALKAQNVNLEAQGWSAEDIEKKNPLLLEAQDMLLKWEQGDETVVSLWKTMNSWVYDGFNSTYKTMGVSFDQYYYESNTYLLGKEVVEEGLANGVFFKKENGSVWIDLTVEGLDEKLVLRGDGTSVYITQDMGTADLKHKDFGIDKSVYVVGNEQDYHFVVLKHIMKKLGRPYADGIYHLSYGMVDLPSGKMKSREGTVVDADDLMQEMITTAREHTAALGKIDDFSTEQAQELYKTLGLGALKYFLLKVDPKKRMMFNPQESIEFQGHTGPFIQYTHARICAILRKAASMGHDNISNISYNINELQTCEKDVIIALSQYPERIKEAGNEYSPSIIANYIFELAKDYNRFYNEVSVFNEPDKNIFLFRIAFSAAVAKTIKSGMLLLGIDVPEKM
jgi:arginyl-tRNA synthetase